MLKLYQANRTICSMSSSSTLGCYSLDGDGLEDASERAHSLDGDGSEDGSESSHSLDSDGSEETSTGTHGSWWDDCSDESSRSR